MVCVEYDNPSGGAPRTRCFPAREGVTKRVLAFFVLNEDLNPRLAPAKETES